MEKTRALTQVEQSELETLLDKTSLASILDALSNISREKAEHVRTNWQDANLARQWDNDANKLERVANNVASF